MTSKYSGMRLVAAKVLCTRRGIEIDDEFTIEDISVLLDEYDAEKEAEKETRKSEAAKEARDLEFEREKATREARKIEAELEVEREKAAREHELKVLELQRARAPDGQGQGGIPAEGSNRPCNVSVNHLEDDADATAYFEYFERTMGVNNVPRTKWAQVLSGVLGKKGQEVFGRLPNDQLTDYDKIKEGILIRYEVFAENCRKRFRTLKKEQNESYGELVYRLGNSMDQWLEKSGAKDDPKKMRDLFVLEQFLDVVSPALKLYLLDRKPKTAAEAGQLGDEYVQNRKHAFGSGEPESSKSRANWSSVKTETGNRGSGNQPTQTQNNASNGNRSGNGYNWRKGPNNANNQAGNRGSVVPGNQATGSHQGNVQQGRGRFYGGAQCFSCGGRGHVARDCPNRTPYHLNSHVQEVVKPNFGLVGSEFIGLVGGVEVTCLYDTGASVSLVDSRLVSPEHYTGDQIYVKTAFDDAIKCLPVACILVESEKFTGEIKAGVYGNLAYQFILGMNFADFNNDTNEVNIVTRAQAKRDKGGKEECQDSCVIASGQNIDKEKSRNKETPVSQERISLTSVGENQVKPETAPQANKEGDLQSVSRVTLIEAQHNNADLQEFFDKTGIYNEDQGVKFFLEKGVLMREWARKDLDKDAQINSAKQIVVPAEYRGKIISMSHDNKGCHTGKKRCAEVILAQFWCQKLRQYLEGYIGSCVPCQRAGNNRDQHREPLVKVPIVQGVWEKVIVDIVGPLKTTKRGNRYILTILDAGTKFAVGVPIPNQEAVTVCSSLIEVFCTFGWCKEIQSDNGSNFKSMLAQTLWEMSGIKCKYSSVTHPESQGALERLHGVIKQSLRAILDENKSIEWDQVLSFVLFAIANATNRSTGFAPSELFFGRKLRGPLNILHDAWMESDDVERVTSVEIVMRHLNTVHDAMQEAFENQDRAQNVRKEAFDRKAKQVAFKEGERVLALVPSRKHKLLCKWTGPWTIIRKVGDVTYLVKTGRGQHTVYHSNQLKSFASRPVQLSSFIRESYVDSSEDEVPCLAPDIVEDGIEGLLGQIDELEIGAQQKARFKAVIEREEKVFSNIPGRTHLGEVTIQVSDEKPIKLPPYRGNPHSTALAKKELDTLESLGLIYRSNSAHGAPLFFVEREGKEPRPVINYKRMNQVIVNDSYRIPLMESLVDKIAGANFVTLFDLCRGFWQLPVAPESQKYTAMTTEFGNFCFTALPMGLKIAPGCFQRLMDTVLAGAEAYSCAYLDDVAIHSNSIEEHIVHVADVLRRVREAGLTIRAKKCMLGQGRIQYLGKYVGGGSLMPLGEKVKAIQEYPMPRTKRDIRAFLGLTGFYSRWISRYADLAVGLTDCLKKEGFTELPPEAIKSVYMLKEALSHEPVLTAPNYERDFYLETDASAKAVSAILSQQDDKGNLRPIAYASRKLQPREQKYGSSELELLAVIFGLSKYKSYLFGMKVIIVSDHQCLKYLSSVVSVNSKLARWSMFIDSFDHEIIHRKGTLSSNVDALSRAVKD